MDIDKLINDMVEESRKIPLISPDYMEGWIAACNRMIDVVCDYKSVKHE